MNNMKEYTITMTFSIEAVKAGVDKVTQFAEDLSQKMLNDNYPNEIDIVDVSIDDVVDHNNYDYNEDDRFLEEDDY